MNRISLPRLLALAAAALAVELTLLDDLAWRGARLELLLILACFGALFARERRPALLACWLIGLIKDAGSSGPLGLHAFLFLLLGWIILEIKQVIFRDSVAVQAAVVAAGCAAVCLATALFVSVVSGGIPASLWITKTLLSTLVTALAAPALIRLLLRPGSLVR